MEKAGGNLPDDKDAKAVKSYFEKAYPDMDFERVYVSDMKKMVKWFSILKANNIEIKLTEVPEEEEEATTVAETPAVAAEKPAKKTPAKKKAAPKDEAAEETPKKTTRKKKAE
jgi:hypothetical protein